MKKFAIGCGVLLAIALVVAAVGTYFVVNKVTSTVAEFAALGEVPAIERGVRNGSTFTPPDSGVLTEDQLSRYLAVQGRVRALLGSRFDQFNATYAELTQRMDKNQGTVLDAPSVIAAYRDLATTYVAAKKAQVEALNAFGFSLSEYRWVRQQAYAALGMPVMDLDVSKLIEDVTSGRQPGEPRLGGAVGPSGPEVNKALVAPHKKTLEDNAALGFFGL